MLSLVNTDIEKKHCKGCNAYKSINDFYKRPSNPNGKYNCKECEVKNNVSRQKKLRIENPEKLLAYEEKYRDKNREAKKISSKKYYDKVGPREYDPKNNYRKYDLTLDDAKHMLSNQKGLCANRACGKEVKLRNGKIRATAFVDHCHTTGSVRGILCLRCNIALGYLEQKNIALGLTEYLDNNLSTQQRST